MIDLLRNWTRNWFTIMLRTKDQHPLTVVMDTKWKLLSENTRNYGISQTDMYQMYAYSKKYDAEKIVLLYPQPEGFHSTDIAFHSDDGVSVEVAFIDLCSFTSITFMLE